MSSSRQTCRWAGLSLSSISSVFFPDVLGRVEANFNHELVAVSTTGGNERAQKWLADNKVPKPEGVTVFNSWEKMLEEGDFDIVYISTPHSLHYDHILKALQCKRNVLVEKPATMNRPQYEKCVQLAEQQGVVLMEAMWTRHLPTTKFFMKEILPTLGEVKRVYSEFSFPVYSPDLPADSRFLDKNAGAGTILDFGVYAMTWADIALNGSNPSGSSGLTNGAAKAAKQQKEEAKVVHADSMPIPNVPGQVDDINTIVLRKSNAVGIVTTAMTLIGSNKPELYSRMAAKKFSPGVRIEGTKAAVAIPFPCSRPTEFEIQRYDDETFIQQGGTELNETLKKEIVGWGIWYQADDIAEAVFDSSRQGKGVALGGEESLRVLGYLDEARRLAGIDFPEKLLKY